MPSRNFPPMLSRATFSFRQGEGGIPAPLGRRARLRHKDEIAQRAHLETALPISARSYHRPAPFVCCAGGRRLMGSGPHRSSHCRPPAAGARRVHAAPARPRRCLRRQQLPARLPVAGGDTASALAAAAPVIGPMRHIPVPPRWLPALITGICRRRRPAPRHLRSASVPAPKSERPWCTPSVRAVTFTGSLHGGRALMTIAPRALNPSPASQRDVQW